MYNIYLNQCSSTLEYIASKAIYSLELPAHVVATSTITGETFQLVLDTIQDYEELSDDNFTLTTKGY